MQIFTAIGAASGFFAVLIGAFGAHGLKGILDDYSLRIFQTGVQYHFYHALALVLVGMLLQQNYISQLRYSGYAFLIGILIFSGSLYLLAITKVKILGAITPIGGLCFLVGWFFLGLSYWKQH